MLHWYCDRLFSAWKQKSAPSPGAQASAPDADKNVSGDKPKNPNVDIDHSMAACRLTGPRKKGKGPSNGPVTGLRMVPWTGQKS